MTKLFDTMLLGMEFAKPNVPYKNIAGTFHAEDNGFAFYSHAKECHVAIPVLNILRWGSDEGQWTRDWGQMAVQLGFEAITLGFFSINRFAYNWIVFHDEATGAESEIWLLVSNGWLNAREADRRQILIGNHISAWRDKVRKATMPYERKTR
jgi:hypothetical protein